jgi:CubicO group peptidase (beta-lactamase class C family)
MLHATRRRGSRLGLLAFALLVGAAACAPVVRTTPAPVNDSTIVLRGPDGARLDSLLLRYEMYGFSGSVLVARGGDIILSKGYGFADREKGVRAQPRTYYDFGSITKTVVGAAILKLEANGRIRVGDSVARVLGPMPEAKRGITIRELATHTSGLPSGGRSTASTDRSAFIETMKNVALESSPGTTYHYSNAGASLLAAMVELVANEPFGDFARRELFQPAGIASGFRWEPEWDARRAKGYHRRPEAPNAEAQEIPMLWGVRGATGWIATVPDVYRWEQAIEHGTLLPARENARLQDTTVEEAFGWHWQPHGRGDLATFAKGGDFPGFQSQVLAYPTRRTVIVWANNDDTRRWRTLLNEGISRIALRESPPSLPPAVIRVDSATLMQLAGSYSDSNGADVEIKSWDNGLYVAGGDSSVTGMTFFRTSTEDFTGLPSKGMVMRTLHFDLDPTGKATRAVLDSGSARRIWRRL